MIFDLDLSSISAIPPLSETWTGIGPESHPTSPEQRFLLRLSGEDRR